jgi:hypothetical protein
MNHPFSSYSWDVISANIPSPSRIHLVQRYDEVGPFLTNPGKIGLPLPAGLVGKMPLAFLAQQLNVENADATQKRHFGPLHGPDVLRSGCGDPGPRGGLWTLKPATTTRGPFPIPPLPAWQNADITEFRVLAIAHAHGKAGFAATRWMRAGARYDLVVSQHAQARRHGPGVSWRTWSRRRRSRSWIPGRRLAVCRRCRLRSHVRRPSGPLRPRPNRRAPRPGDAGRTLPQERG